MCEARLQSDVLEIRPQTGPGLPRVAGGIGLRVAARDGRSYAADVRERDGYKLRFPRGTANPEAVIINTGGGLAGGDRVTQSVTVGDGARATVTTQSAERVYRALGEAETTLDVSITLGEDARLNWLPQETILFDHSRLARSIDVDIAASARLLLVETIIFGRTAMGETVRSGSLRDKWRIRHGGKLVFAENIRLDGSIADALGKAAIANGAQITSTIISVGTSAGDRLNNVRDVLEGASCEAGASAWGPLLVVRALGRNAESLRRMHERVIPLLSGEPLPRVWQS
jgi:urease accessory protein